MSGITYYKSGHLYFTLKDKKSQVRCAAFNYKGKRIQEDLKEGDSVKIFGDVGFYETRGDFQILVSCIEKKDGTGELFKQLEILKREMEEEGYFSSMHKKPLPKYPQSIGVVTSYTGAALQDIINTVRKRFENVDIYVYPAKVQGEGAAKEIAEGIRELNKIPEIDLIIAGRGGGSIEDLWAFNEKETALAFFNSKKPIISAVGHEIDYLLTDLVADVRAATPTQAVEIAIPEKRKIYEMLEQKENELKKILKRKLEEKANELIYAEENLNRAMEQKFKKAKDEMELRAHKLIALNPLNVLLRGYTLTFKGEEQIKEVSGLRVGDEITTRFAEGKVKSVIKEIE
jgi:exodeoxyribonuclease VII large subunit